MDCDCIISYFYHMAVGHAELRSKLGRYEDTGLDPDGIKEATCEYSEDEDGIWSCSKCDSVWTFINGGPKENNVHYYPKCGRKIAKWNEYVDEDEE